MKNEPQTETEIGDERAPIRRTRKIGRGLMTVAMSPCLLLPLYVALDRFWLHPVSTSLSDLTVVCLILTFVIATALPILLWSRDISQPQFTLIIVLLMIGILGLVALLIALPAKSSYHVLFRVTQDNVIDVISVTSIAGLMLLIGAFIARAKDTDNPNLIYYLTFMFIAGAVFIAVPYVTATEKRLMGEIFRDVGIALCISVIIAIIIEISLAQETFSHGLDAIMKQTVPPAVWEEFRLRLIHQEIMREDWSLTMNIQPDPYKKPPFFVSTTTMSYKIVALQDRITTSIHPDLDDHRDVLGGGMRFKKVTIDGKPYDQKEIRNNGWEDRASKNKLNLPVKLPKKNKSTTYELEFIELVHQRDTITWWMPYTTNKLTVQISSPSGWQIHPETFHPAGTFVEVEPTKWEFPGLMFPGQGFEIRIRPDPKNQSVQQQGGSAIAGSSPASRL